MPSWIGWKIDHHKAETCLLSSCCILEAKDGLTNIWQQSSGTIKRWLNPLTTAVMAEQHWAALLSVGVVSNHSPAEINWIWKWEEFTRKELGYVSLCGGERETSKAHHPASRRSLDGFFQDVFGLTVRYFIHCEHKEQHISMNISFYILNVPVSHDSATVTRH